LFLLAFFARWQLGQNTTFLFRFKTGISQATGFVNVKLVTAWDSKSGGAIDARWQ